MPSIFSLSPFHFWLPGSQQSRTVTKALRRSSVQAVRLFSARAIGEDNIPLRACKDAATVKGNWPSGNFTAVSLRTPIIRYRIVGSTETLPMRQNKCLVCHCIKRKTYRICYFINHFSSIPFLYIMSKQFSFLKVAYLL